MHRSTALALIDVLEETKRYLSSEDNDFTYSSWEDAPSALAEVEALIASVKDNDPKPELDFEILYAPTGPVQEVSLSSGWGETFLELANRADKIIAAYFLSATN